MLVNVHAHAQAVRDYVSQCHNGVSVTLFEESALLGSAGTLAVNRKWVSSEPCFWVFYADVLTNINLLSMLQFHRSQNTGTTIGVYRVPDPERCGIVTVDDRKRVRQFVEKPAAPPGNLAFSGILIGDTDLLGAIPEGRPADLGHDVLPKLIGNMSAYEVCDYMLDIGTFQNYEIAQATWPGLPQGGGTLCSPE